MSAAAQRPVFVALKLTLLCLASQQSVLAQDYTWTGRTAPVAQSWEGVTYGNGLFVAIAQWNEGSDVDDFTGWHHLDLTNHPSPLLFGFRNREVYRHRNYYTQTNYTLRR
jgi:hypothetical protein